MILTVILLLAGFFILIKGADFFVDGSSSIARLLRIPSIIVGLTIVAFGTSAPELSVSVSAAMSGSNEIALSNVLGSNIFNLLVVTGASALIHFVPVSDEIRRRDLPVSILAAALTFIFALPAGGQMRFERWEGIILLAIFALYLFIQIRSALRSRKTAPEDPMEGVLSPFRSVALIVIGCVMVVLGGNLVVDKATVIAQALGWSQTLIGLTIVAIGTSLPELVTYIVAAKKGEYDLSIGNVVGSNIFNILMILGLSTSLHPIPAKPTALFDSAFLILISVMVLVFSRTSKRINRAEGIVMLAAYAIYDIYIILR